MKKEESSSREGRCYELAFRHILEHQEGTLVHGLAYSNNLKRMIDHAWVITDTGFVYEPVTDQYFHKDFLYKNYHMVELAAYSVEEAMAKALSNRTYGPWHKEAKRES